MGWGKKQFKQILQLLPEGWKEKAKELGAFQRARGIKTPEDLLWLMLLHLTEGKSFSGTKAITALSDVTDICKTAMFNRIQKSGAWLRWMCENICRNAGLLVEKPQWLQGRDVSLADGSEDVRCGKDKQCFMPHCRIDLFTLSEKEFHITDMKTGEKLGNFKKLGKNDIVVGDRAYGTLPGIACLKQYGADYVLRIKGKGFPMYDKKGEKIGLLDVFSGLNEGECGEITVFCKINDCLEPVRVCALRKDADSERKGLKKLKKTNQRKSGGKPVSELQKGYNKYIIAVTSLGKEASPKQILELYRARWQIEIAFKRLKTIFGYNEMPARLEENIKTWFYGKLLLAALCETLVNTGRFSPCGGRKNGRNKKT